MVVIAPRHNTFVEMVTRTEEERMQVKRNRRWWTVMLQTVLGIMAIGLTSLTHASGLIPGTHPVFSGQELHHQNELEDCLRILTTSSQ